MQNKLTYSRIPRKIHLTLNIKKHFKSRVAIRSDVLSAQLSSQIKWQYVQPYNEGDTTYSVCFLGYSYSKWKGRMYDCSTSIIYCILHTRVLTMQILLFHLGGRHVHCKNTTFVTVFDGTIQEKIINVFYQFESVKKLNYSLQMNLGFWEGNPLTLITPIFWKFALPLIHNKLWIRPCP